MTKAEHDLILAKTLKDLIAEHLLAFYSAVKAKDEEATVREAQYLAALRYFGDVLCLDFKR